MDNFMDKLAEKYNAQDMIRANSQAETAQMQSLQDQVEAYEAVLQEMRKLNYKNTELTEKMYALVDASIEKVRTLQIEASEGGVSTAEVSREMQDAVNQAVSEAISSMDETMARTLAQSLQQPTDEMRQSNERMAEDVRNSLETSLQAVQASAESTRTATDQVNEKLTGLDAQMQGVKEEMTQAHADIREIAAATDLLMEAVTNAAQKGDAPSETLMQVLEKLQEGSTQLNGIKAAQEEQMPAEAPKEVLEKLQEVSAQIETLKEENRRNDVAEKLQEISAQIAAMT